MPHEIVGDAPHRAERRVVEQRRIGAQQRRDHAERVGAHAVSEVEARKAEPRRVALDAGRAGRVLQQLVLDLDVVLLGAVEPRLEVEQPLARRLDRGRIGRRRAFGHREPARTRHDDPPRVARHADALVDRLDHDALRAVEQLEFGEAAQRRQADAGHRQRHDIERVTDVGVGEHEDRAGIAHRQHDLRLARPAALDAQADGRAGLLLGRAHAHFPDRPVASDRDVVFHRHRHPHGRALRDRPLLDDIDHASAVDAERRKIDPPRMIEQRPQRVIAHEHRGIDLVAPVEADRQLGAAADCVDADHRPGIGRTGVFTRAAARSGAEGARLPGRRRPRRFDRRFRRRRDDVEHHIGAVVEIAQLGVGGDHETEIEMLRVGPQNQRGDLWWQIAPQLVDIDLGRRAEAERNRAPAAFDGERHLARPGEGQPAVLAGRADAHRNAASRGRCRGRRCEPARRDVLRRRRFGVAAVCGFGRCRAAHQVDHHARAGAEGAQAKIALERRDHAAAVAGHGDAVDITGERRADGGEAGLDRPVEVHGQAPPVDRRAVADGGRPVEDDPAEARMGRGAGRHAIGGSGAGQCRQQRNAERQRAHEGEPAGHQ